LKSQVDALFEAPAKKKDGVQRMRRTPSTCCKGEVLVDELIDDADDGDEEVTVDLDVEVAVFPSRASPPWSSSS
jgi:hypothetical protein